MCRMLGYANILFVMYQSEGTPVSGGGSGRTKWARERRGSGARLGWIHLPGRELGPAGSAGIRPAFGRRRAG